MNILRPLIVAILAVNLAGCAAGLVSPDKAASVGNGISVMPQRAWNKVGGDPETWTSEGPQIDRISFYTGIKAGRPLVAGIRDDRLNFDAKMLPNDIQDLVVTTLTRQGYQTVRSGNLAPCPFGDSKGFCFDLSFSTPDRLEMKGLVAARKQNDLLDVILFQAPNEYYFGQLSPDVSKVFASVQAK